MKNPTRPGQMVKNILEELEITVTRASELLGVTRQTLNHLINHEGSSVSPEMALRLECVFGSTAENWLRMQAAYDASRVIERKAEITKGLKRFEPV